MMNEDILRQIGAIARCFDSVANIEFKDLKLSRGQYLYLVRIYEQPGIISERLADLVSVDRTTTARAVKKLVAAKLAQKRPDRENRKIRRLFVTEKGRDLARLIERENNFSNKSVLSGLSASEQKQLQALLGRLAENSRAIWHQVKKNGRRKY